MAKAVIAMAFEGKIAAELGDPQRSPHSIRIGAEFAIDNFRSASEEVLTGQVRRLGYADSLSLQKAWTARLDLNAAARRTVVLTASVAPAALARRVA
ncbi:hypothetical protein MKK60_22350 [Methylobacterium sp. J-092]|nr:hypothetical protein [Methylobacterium sp. J-092]